MDTRFLGRVDYLPTYEAMQAFTDERYQQNNGRIDLEPLYSLPDQLWICEHNPVFTQGLAGKTEHILNAGSIPIIQTNRGGQVTYHGPGQVVAYPLLNLKRSGYFVKEYVYRLEEAVIRTLTHFNVTGHRVGGAPGIYVRLDDPSSHAILDQRLQKRLVGNPSIQHDEKSATINFAGLGKIAALGIKVSRHFSYHGVALNVSMDLEPFSHINPCGYTGLQTVDLCSLGLEVSVQDVALLFAKQLQSRLVP